VWYLTERAVTVRHTTQPHAVRRRTVTDTGLRTDHFPCDSVVRITALSDAQLLFGGVGVHHNAHLSHQPRGGGRLTVGSHSHRLHARRKREVLKNGAKKKRREKRDKEQERNTKKKREKKRELKLANKNWSHTPHRVVPTIERRCGHTFSIGCSMMHDSHARHDMTLTLTHTHTHTHTTQHTADCLETDSLQ
jgi:hypothetical protein